MSARGSVAAGQQQGRERHAEQDDDTGREAALGGGAQRAGPARTSMPEPTLHAGPGVVRAEARTPTATNTTTATNTATPTKTSTPTVTLTPRVIDCTKPDTFLFGLSKGGGAFEIHNFSTNCITTVQAASYLIPSGNPFDTDIAAQLFFAATAPTSIGPGQVLTLVVAVPGCAFQAEAFFGSLNNPMAGSDLYVGRLLAAERGGNG